jgi:hypothetical protein
MTAAHLRANTRDDIGIQVSKVLRGLGNPEPPLRLEDVRLLLKLDRNYYSGADDSILRESVSRLKVAGQQVISRPTLLLEAIKKLSLRALYLPDKRRILLDKDLPILKHRWNEAHEIGHSVIPWHQGLMGDDELTLTSSCHYKIEAEANFAAGQLLFLGPRFLEEARSLTPGLEAITKLTQIFGNTKTSTLWRYVEQLGVDRPLFAMISCHPHVLRRDDTFNPDQPCRHFVESDAFVGRFGSLSEKGLFAQIANHCGAQRGGLIGEDDILLQDLNGADHIFHFETFFNRYDALTLGVYSRPVRLQLAG